MERGWGGPAAVKGGHGRVVRPWAHGDSARAASGRAQEVREDSATVVRSGGLGARGLGGLADQPAERAQVDQEVADLDLLLVARQPVGGHALEAEALKLAVAALGEVAAPVAGLPSVRAVGDLARQAE